MGTLLCFHAHPDDEAIATGGTMARAADEGHRVVAVFATRGEHGEYPEDFLAEGEQLWQRREQETHAAARVLGVARVEFLGYKDSGMAGTPENDLDGSFHRADVEEASQRLAEIVRQESVDVLTIYDVNGTYRHPDHIKVHQVGVAAAAIAGTPKVYESVVDRERVQSLFRRFEDPELRAQVPDLELPSDEELADLGVPSELVTTTVDVTGYIDQKRAAMAAHASQISETSFFLALPPDVYPLVWGVESFSLRGAPMGTKEDWIF